MWQIKIPWLYNKAIWSGLSGSDPLCPPFKAKKQLPHGDDGMRHAMASHGLLILLS